MKYLPYATIYANGLVVLVAGAAVVADTRTRILAAIAEANGDPGTYFPDEDATIPSTLPSVPTGALGIFYQPRDITNPGNAVDGISETLHTPSFTSRFTEPCADLDGILTEEAVTGIAAARAALDAA